MKKIGVYCNKNQNISELLTNYFLDKAIITDIKDLEDITDNTYDLIVLNDCQSKNIFLQNTTVINIHPSLLPAFKCENAIVEAFTSGVKVGGVTIHTTNKNSENNKIIAQYPVLIGLTTHIDEYTKEIESVIYKLLPPVVDALINDRIFDFSDLFKHPCQNSCSSCKGCKH